MLREIHISNLAVIADARIELSAGLNCFTGATGAGKSLVIGAIEVLLGLRSPADMLRRGAEEGRVSGVFEIASPEVLRRLSEIADMPLATREVLLTRRLHASGRSSVSLNGHPITLAMLKQVAECLVDIHGQHDHQYLLKPSNQLDVLDDFAGARAVRSQYEQLWTQWSHAKARYTELIEGRTLRQQQLELYRFQAFEIDSAALSRRELATLTQRARLLGNTERLRNEAGACQSALDEGDQPLVQQVKSVAATLSQLADLDPGLRNIALAVKEASIGLQEAAFDLARYLDRIEVDPEALAATNERLTLIGKLASKYAKSRVAAGESRPSPDPSEASSPGHPPDEVSQILAYRAQVEARITVLQAASEDLDGLEDKLTAWESQARSLATELTALRSRAAARLAREVEAGLADLGMSKAKLAVEVRPLGALGPCGGDAVEFLASTNPGLDPAPLRKIASGGELSRIMLALKGILCSDSRVSVLVFDEIDANVGGRLGAIIGWKLRSLASRQQVLCITHLPQIAAHADRHLTVRKLQTDDATSSTVREMTGDERIREIAEMIGGDRITPVTLAQAREMIENAAVHALGHQRRAPLTDTAATDTRHSGSDVITSSPSGRPTAPARPPAQPIERKRRSLSARSLPTVRSRVPKLGKHPTPISTRN
jgi:DNA repair protein RecN (Recombination protein N)